MGGGGSLINAQYSAPLSVVNYKDFIVGRCTTKLCRVRCANKRQKPWHGRVTGPGNVDMIPLRTHVTPNVAIDLSECRMHVLSACS